LNTALGNRVATSLFWFCSRRESWITFMLLFLSYCGFTFSRSCLFHSLEGRSEGIWSGKDTKKYFNHITRETHICTKRVVELFKNIPI